MEPILTDISYLPMLGLQSHWEAGLRQALLGGLHTPEP
jgi:hypothetical protein